MRVFKPDFIQHIAECDEQLMNSKRMVHITDKRLKENVEGMLQNTDLPLDMIKMIVSYIPQETYLSDGIKNARFTNLKPKVKSFQLIGYGWNRSGVDIANISDCVFVGAKRLFDCKCGASYDSECECDPEYGGLTFPNLPFNFENIAIGVTIFLLMVENQGIPRVGTFPFNGGPSPLLVKDQAVEIKQFFELEKVEEIITKEDVLSNPKLLAAFYPHDTPYGMCPFGEDTSDDEEETKD